MTPETVRNKAQRWPLMSLVTGCCSDGMRVTRAVRTGCRAVVTTVMTTRDDHLATWALLYHDHALPTRWPVLHSEISP
jgi:hypothetical protein